MKRILPLIAAVFTLVAIHASAGPCYAQQADVSGNWSGTTRVTPPCGFSSGRCNAVNNITFALKFKGDRLKGKYTCAYGNLNCRNGGSDNTGKIVSGRISGNQLRLSVINSRRTCPTVTTTACLPHQPSSMAVARAIKAANWWRRAFGMSSARRGSEAKRARGR